MSVLKDHYYKLGSEVAGERIEAASALLSELVKVDKTDDYDYALQRLITGLTTSRQSARFGFSMALTELIRELILKDSYELTVQSYLEKLVKATQVTSAMKGKETRSVLFGRLFGLQALVNSEILLNSEVSNQELLVLFVQQIVQLSATKSWLRETAMFTLCQFLTLFMKSSFFDESTLVLFLQSVSDEGLTFTVEGLAVHLTIPQPLRSRVSSQVTATNNWKNFDPMSKGNVPTLAKVLKDVDAVNDGEKSEEDKKSKNSKQKSTWSPKIPFVWELILKYFQEDNDDDIDAEILVTSKKRKKSASSTPKKKAKADKSEILLLKEFWKVVVDETMFSDKSSVERKFWGFDIFNLFIEKLPASLVLDLFTPNLMRCLINQSAKSDRLLNKVSTKSLNLIIQISQRDLSKVPPMLTSILNEDNGGCWNFDSLTKSKVTDSLISVLSYVDNVSDVSDSDVDRTITTIEDILITEFNKALEGQKETTEEIVYKKSNDNILKWVMDKLLLLLRSTKRFKTNKTKMLDDIFKFLIRYSFFKSDKGQQVSTNVVKLAQDRLNSYLSEVISQKRKDHSWSLYCVKQIEKFEKKEDYELVLELDGDLAAIKDETLQMLDTIKDMMKRDESSIDQQYCFELLFSMVLIQLYMGESETVGVLEEIKTCYTDSFSKSDEEEEVETSVILTEIILSFISRKSSLLKKLSTIVWESFLCAKGTDSHINLNDKCFQLLFDILKTKENEEGQKALFEGEEEYGVDEESDEEEVEEEETDKTNKNTPSVMDSDNDSDADGEIDSDDEMDVLTNVDKETSIKLAKALGIPTEYNGEVKFDEIDDFGEDDDDFESDSMDDEQMMAMDDELSRIFKERHDILTANNANKKKAEMVQAKEQILLFKNRVLDLLESFSKTQPNSLYNIQFIRPIITLINTTTDKNLGTKAHKLLKTRISKVKASSEDFEGFAPTQEEKKAYVASLLEIVEWLQQQAGTYSSNQAHSLACSQSCIIVSKTIVLLDSTALPSIISVYSGALTKWATEPKNRIQASMFFDFINWLNAKRSLNA